MRLVCVRQEALYRGYRIEGTKEGECGASPRGTWRKAAEVVCDYVDQALRDQTSLSHTRSADRSPKESAELSHNERRAAFLRRVQRRMLRGLNWVSAPRTRHQAAPHPQQECCRERGVIERRSLQGKASDLRHPHSSVCDSTNGEYERMSGDTAFLRERLKYSTSDWKRRR
jgi:hypothetical protein